jgi:homocysteine S-methyltransferase
MTLTILDGGMGQELIARSPKSPTPLWATQVMLETPDMVQDIHADFFRAGADIATVNSYSIHHDRLIPAGLDAQFETLHIRACELARAARDAHGSGRLAGALGPLGGSYSVHEPPANAVELFAEICAIQAPYVDMYLIETASSIAQARAALDAALRFDKPVWVGVSVDDADGTRLRSGELVRDAVRMAEDCGADAFFINCSTPEAVTKGLHHIQDATITRGAYANGFTRIEPSFIKKGATVSELSARKDLSPARYADFAQTWVDLGATIIGGCCEVSPAHIAEIVRRLA